MRYLVIDEKNWDMFVDEFESKEEALDHAESEWNHLSEYDRNHRTAFFVLESENPDEEAEDHLDGTPIKIFK